MVKEDAVTGWVLQKWKFDYIQKNMIFEQGIGGI